MANEEREPFLPSPQDSEVEETDPPDDDDDQDLWQIVFDFKDFLANNPILICTFCLQFFFYLAKHMVEVPTIKLVEQAICNRYYAHQEDHGQAPTTNSDVAEQYCKLPAIQHELAAITGLKFTFDALPALLTALYYGSIADRFGRRLVLGLCCIGTLCSYIWILLICTVNWDIPVRLVWASSVFLCIGGSQRVAKGMNFTVVADATEKANRTRFMYILAGIPHATTLIAPPVSGVLMSKRIWLPFVVSIGALTLSLLIVLVMPESLHLRQKPHSPILGPADTLGDDESEEVSTPAEQLPRGIHDRMPAPMPSKKEWWRDIITLIQMPGLPFCYLLFLFKPMAMIAKAYVYQYASWNFHWTLARTTWLRFSQAAGSTIVTIIVLPLVTSGLNRRGLQAQRLDINVIRISLFIAMLGFLLIQFSFFGWMLATGLFIAGLSEGEEPALQGLATSLIDRDYHARLFTSVAVVEIIAKLVGGPVMGRLFAITKRDGGGSMGLCFSASAAILLMLLITALIQKMKR